MSGELRSAILTGGMKRRPPDSLDGIPAALRLLPVAGVLGWLAAVSYAIAYALS